MKKRGGRAGGGWSETLPRYGGGQQTCSPRRRCPNFTMGGWLPGLYVRACVCARSIGEGLERGADGMAGTQTVDASFSGSNL